MRANYDSFLNSKLKIMGFEIVDYYAVFITWAMFSYLKMDEFIKIGILAVLTISYFTVKKKLKPNALFFYLKKKKYTYLKIGNSHE